MRTADFRGFAITSLLFGILVLNALYSSEIGGPGTLFNTFGFLLAFVILLLHGRFHPFLLIAFYLILLDSE